MSARIDLTPRPPRDALAYFRGKGWAPPESRFHYLDMFRADHARAFVVAKATRDDVLGTLRAAVEGAIERGETFAAFSAALEPELKRLGWWGKGTMRDPLTGQLQSVQLGSARRLRVIFDANIRAAHAAGQWARIQRSKEAFPYLRYRQMQRPSKRDEHEPYHALILPVDHPAWRVLYPPNGWSCGCSVAQVSERELKRRGWSVAEDYTPPSAPYTNPRTGETVSVPEGVDPAWSSNPGIDWLDTDRAVEAVAGDLPRPVRASLKGGIDATRLFGIGENVEKLTLLDLDTGDLVGWSTGKRGSVGPSPGQLEAMRRPGGRHAAIHNHPSSTALSDADIETLAAMDGLREVIAIGHDGSLYRAVAQDGLRPGMATAAFRDARAHLQALVNDGIIAPGEATRLWAHLSMLKLASDGAIDYLYHLDAATADLINELLGPDP